jgi:hypothetical protein
MIPSVSLKGVKLPPNVSRPPGGLSLTLASKRERSPEGPQGAAEDLRRIVGRRLRPTCKRESSPGDQRGTEGGTAGQEPAAAGVLLEGCWGFGVGNWIAHWRLLGP